MNQANKNEAILRGVPLPTLLSFAVPIILGNLFQQLYNIVDAVVVGQYLGDLPLDGMSAASPIIDITNCLIVGVTVGIGVFAALLCGGGKLEELKKAHSTALIGGSAAVLLLSGLGLLFSEKILLSQGNDPEVCREAMQYLSVILAGLIFSFLYNYYASMLRSCGNSRTPFIVLLTSSCLHAGLDFLLIGVFGFGIRAVGFSTVFCQLFSALWMIIYTYRKDPRLTLKKNDFCFVPALAKELVGYAWASALQQTVVSIGRMLVQGTLIGLGADTVTGYNMALRVEQFIYCLPQGIAASMVVCVSQNRGSGNRQRMHDFYLYSAVSGVICYLLLGSMCIFCAPSLIAIFSSKEEVIAAGAVYTHFMGFAYILSYLGENIQSFFRGMGRLRLTMAASTIQVILRVILSYTLVPKLGIVGICLSVISGWFLLVAVEGGYSVLVARKLKKETAAV